MRIEDQGRGFDAAAVLSAAEDGGFGVRGMRDRVLFFKGRFRLSSEPGAGTVVEAEIPLPDGGADSAAKESP